RVLVTWLVLDTSPSMRFGTADRRKADVAEGVAVAVGHVATRRGNRLGVVTFGDRNPRSAPVRQGRRGLISLLGALREEAGQTAERVGATSLGDGTAASRRHAQRQAPAPLRRGGRGRARRPEQVARVDGRPARRSVHLRRLAAGARALPPESGVSFSSPLWLLALLLLPLLVVA